MDVQRHGQPLNALLKGGRSVQFPPRWGADPWRKTQMQHFQGAAASALRADLR